MGKGEIARYEQFLLFQQCFKRLVLQTRKNQCLFGERLKTNSLILSSFNFRLPRLPFSKRLKFSRLIYTLSVSRIPTCEPRSVKRRLNANARTRVPHLTQNKFSIQSAQVDKDQIPFFAVGKLFTYLKTILPPADPVDCYTQ